MSEFDTTKDVTEITDIAAAAKIGSNRMVAERNDAFIDVSTLITAILAVSLPHRARLHMLRQLQEFLVAFEFAIQTNDGQERLLNGDQLVSGAFGSDSVRDSINETAAKLHLTPAYLAQLVSTVFGPLEQKTPEMRAEILMAIQRLVRGDFGTTSAGGRLEMEERNRSLEEQLRQAQSVLAIPAPKVDTSRISDLESQLAAARAEVEQLRQQVANAKSSQDKAVTDAVERANQAAKSDLDAAVRDAVTKAVNAGTHVTARDRDAAVNSAVGEAIRKGEVIRKDEHDNVVRTSVAAAHQDVDDRIREAAEKLLKQIAGDAAPKAWLRDKFVGDDDLVVNTGDNATDASQALRRLVNNEQIDLTALASSLVPQSSSSQSGSGTQSNSGPKPTPGPRNGGQSGQQGQQGRPGSRRSSAPAGSPRTGS